MLLMQIPSSIYMFSYYLKNLLTQHMCMHSFEYTACWKKLSSYYWSNFQSVCKGSSTSNRIWPTSPWICAKVCYLWNYENMILLTIGSYNIWWIFMFLNRVMIIGWYVQFQRGPVTLLISPASMHICSTLPCPAIIIGGAGFKYL